MTIQTAIWIPPSLCGCQLQITADWTDGSVVNGISYRHPKPFTITDVQIVNMCAGCTPNSAAMPDVSHLYETSNITGKPYQARGYLSHPIANPTAAHNLYQFLCSHGGQTHSFPCGCAAHMHIAPDGTATYLVKAGVTQKCINHQNDTIDMQQAKADYNAMQGVVA